MDYKCELLICGLETAFICYNMFNWGARGRAFIRPEPYREDDAYEYL